MIIELRKPNKDEAFVLSLIVLIVFGAGVFTSIMISPTDNTNHISEQNGLIISTQYVTGSWIPKDPILTFDNSIATYFIPSSYHYSAIYEYSLQIGTKTSIPITRFNTWIETTAYGGESECIQMVAINRTSGERFIMNYSGYGCY